MCLGIPMQIVSIDRFVATCGARGIERVVNLILLDSQQLKIGDYIVVDRGYAISTIPEEEAKRAWDLYDEMLAASRNRLPSIE